MAAQRHLTPTPDDVRHVVGPSVATTLREARQDVNRHPEDADGVTSIRVARQTVFVLVLIVAGCGSQLATSAGQTAGTTPALTGSVLGPGAGINVANATGLTVAVYVNGQFARSFEAGQGALLNAVTLPALPWDVVAKTSSGRVLTSMTVHQGDATWTDGVQTGVTYRTVSARVDLSCGRLDVWAGSAPPMGPQGGPGSPGDCEP